MPPISSPAATGGRWWHRRGGILPPTPRFSGSPARAINASRKFRKENREGRATRESMEQRKAARPRKWDKVPPPTLPAQNVRKKKDWDPGQRVGQLSYISVGG